MSDFLKSEDDLGDLRARYKALQTDPEYKDKYHIPDEIDVDYQTIFKDFSIPASSCKCFIPTEADMQRAFPSSSEDDASNTEVIELRGIVPTAKNGTSRSDPLPPNVKIASGPLPISNKRQKVTVPTKIVDSLTISDEDDDPVLRNDFITGLEALNKQTAKESSSRGVKKTGGTPMFHMQPPRQMGLCAPYRNPCINPGETKNLPPKTGSVAASEKLAGIDKALIEKIESEMMETASSLTWDDISGLEYAKSIIQETVVMPHLRPDLFTGLRRPAKGILLFGPPGTGKTLIGKCIASQSNSKFFSISASSLTSKWIGESEKLVRTLFIVAALHQPSVVFVDEIDSMLCKRSENENECTRRMKTEFMISMDGATTKEDDRVLIIGATNRPQELDDAVRRRLVKRLYIPLPDEMARVDMLRRLLKGEKNELSLEQLQGLAKSTEGYSGADMKALCSEAALGPIRGYSMSDLQSLRGNEVRPVSFNDFELALQRVKATVDQAELDAYIQWDKAFGCGR